MNKIDKKRSKKIGGIIVGASLATALSLSTLGCNRNSESEYSSIDIAAEDNSLRLTIDGKTADKIMNSDEEEITLPFGDSEITLKTKDIQEAIKLATEANDSVNVFLFRNGALVLLITAGGLVTTIKVLADFADTIQEIELENNEKYESNKVYKKEKK